MFEKKLLTDSEQMTQLVQNSTTHTNTTELTCQTPPATIKPHMTASDMLFGYITLCMILSMHSWLVVGINSLISEVVMSRLCPR